MSPISSFIEQYHLVMVKAISTDEHVYLRSTISSSKEAVRFLKDFSQKTNTGWIIYYGSKKPQKVIFHKTWLCHRSKLRKTKQSVKNANCPAKIDILVKKINRDTAKNDTFIEHDPPLPCVIQMYLKHSPTCYEDTTLKLLHVSDEVKEKFFTYFDKGFSVSKARREHEVDLKSQNQSAIRCSRFNPTLRQASHLYNMWRSRNMNKAVSTINRKLGDLTTISIKELFQNIPMMDTPVKKRKEYVPAMAIPKIQVGPKPLVYDPLVRMPDNCSSLTLPKVNLSQLPTRMRSSHVKSVSVPHVLFAHQAPMKYVNSPIQAAPSSQTFTNIIHQLPASSMPNNSLNYTHPVRTSEVTVSYPLSSSSSFGHGAIKEEPPDTFCEAAANADSINSVNASSSSLPVIVGVYSFANYLQSRETDVTIKTENIDCNEDKSDNLTAGKQTTVQSGNPAFGEFRAEDLPFGMFILLELGRLTPSNKAIFKTKLMDLLHECQRSP